MSVCHCNLVLARNSKFEMVSEDSKISTGLPLKLIFKRVSKDPATQAPVGTWWSLFKVMDCPFSHMQIDPKLWQKHLCLKENLTVFNLSEFFGGPFVIEWKDIHLHLIQYRILYQPHWHVSNFCCVVALLTTINWENTQGLN